MKALWIISKWLAISSIMTVVALGAAILIGTLLEGHLAGATWDGVQAVGSILAIVAGFVAIRYQQRQQRADLQALEAATARAALFIVNDAFGAVAERLNTALIPIGESPKLALKRARTTELVNTVREFDLGRLPACVLVDFVQLRSHVTAVNEWLTVVYGDEDGLTGDAKATKRAERPKRLRSSVDTWRNGVEIFDHLRTTVFDNYGRVPLKEWETDRIDRYR